MSLLIDPRRILQGSITYLTLAVSIGGNFALFSMQASSSLNRLSPIKSPSMARHAHDFQVPFAVFFSLCVRTGCNCGSKATKNIDDIH